MPSLELRTSSSHPNTGLLHGSGLDYLGWGGRRPPECTETSRKSQFHRLSPSIPPPSLPQVSCLHLAKPRQESGEGETVGGAGSSLGCWLNSPSSFPPLTF